MNPLDTSQTKERLRAALEMQVLWRNLIIVLATTAVMLFIFAIGDEFDGYFWAYAGVIAAVILGPTVIFTAIRTFRIFRKPEAYIFCRGVLAQPHSAWRYAMYYTVVLEDPDNGSKFFVDTHAIFLSHGIMGPTIEEYTNKTVTIAYNRETEMVVVIG